MSKSLPSPTPPHALTVRHTPATALPWMTWRQLKDGSENVVNSERAFVCEVGIPIGDPEERDYRHDALYIAHACNAYPKLIAMLQRAALDENYEADHCLDLMRELGELI